MTSLVPAGTALLLHLFHYVNSAAQGQEEGREEDHTGLRQLHLPGACPSWGWPPPNQRRATAGGPASADPTPQPPVPAATYSMVDRRAAEHSQPALPLGAS